MGGKRRWCRGERGEGKWWCWVVLERVVGAAIGCEAGGTREAAVRGGSFHAV